MMIRSVSDASIRIGDKTYTQTIALTGDAIIEDFAAPPFDELVEADFEPVLATNPELVVIGTGDRNVFPPRQLTFAFARRGVGLEVMDTAAAARTFNVLAAEGRRLAAVLYL